MAIINSTAIAANVNGHNSLFPTTSLQETQTSDPSFTLTRIGQHTLNTPLDPGCLCYPSLVLRIDRSAWILAVVSGVLQVLIFPRPNLYPLAWAAFAPLLIALLRARPSNEVRFPATFGSALLPASPAQGFLLAYVSGVIWYAGTCYWVYDTMHQYGGLSTPAALGVVVLFCLYLGIYHGFFGLLVALLAGGKEKRVRRALFLSPFVWVAVELARSRITAFPWDLLGTAQVDNISLTRIATITGVYGVSFEILLVNTVFAAAFLVSREKRKIILIDALAVAVILQLMGLIRMPISRPDHTALLVQENIPILNPAEWTTQYFADTIGELNRLSSPSSRGPHSGRPDLIVWPESPAPFYVSDPPFRDAITAVARRNQTYVLAGSLGTDSATQRSQASRMYNSAVLIDPNGELVARYDKIHLVPFGEYLPFPSIFGFAGGLTREVGEFTHGASREPLPVGDYSLGVFICYESVFPDEVRLFARRGAQVFVNVSNDGWYGDSGAFAQHLNQARMRAIENHRWLVRSTNTGVTASIDPYGRLVARLPRNVRTPLEAPYGLVSSTTFYTRHGDWFAYLCAIISAVALLVRFRVRAGTVR